jgi:hypothetical protein
MKTKINEEEKLNEVLKLENIEILWITDGSMGKRLRRFIEYAPVGLTLKVRGLPSKIQGFKVNGVWIDEEEKLNE